MDLLVKILVYWFLTKQITVYRSLFQHQILKLSDEQIFNNIMKYGNTTAASVPIALTEAVQQGRIKEGGFSSARCFWCGFTWGSAIIRW